MGAIAYALRDEFTGTVDQRETEDAEPVTVPVFTGGPISVDTDREIHLGEALEEGGGTIVIDDGDGALIVALDGYPALKRVAVPEGAEPVAGDYDSQTNAALRAELNRRGVTGGGNKSHDELVAALEAYDALDDLPADLTVKSLEEAAAGAEGGGE